jgi:membrane-bound lytic murein transglycosylase
VDLFMGAGDVAALRAGQMRQPGNAYLLLPRPPAKLAGGAPPN